MNLIKWVKFLSSLDPNDTPATPMGQLYIASSGQEFVGLE